MLNQTGPISRNIWATAEWICTKFTGKTCLVPRSEEFEGQGLKVKGRHQGKNALSAAATPRQRANGMRSLQTAPLRRCRG